MYDPFIDTLNNDILIGEMIIIIVHTCGEVEVAV